MVNSAGSIRFTPSEVVHPLASVINTLFIPPHNPVGFMTLDILGVHAYEYGIVPLPTTTDAVPSQAPKQDISLDPLIALTL